MYSFLRRPAWILSHVLVGILIVAMIGLGFWQRSRYYEERDKQARVEEQMAAPPASLDEVVPKGTDPGSVDESVRYRRVSVTGTYAVDDEVAILNRSYGGAPGAWVLTPLIRDDGSAVPVIRGWIPYDPAGEETPFTDALPPEGEVTITGAVHLTQRRGSVGPVDPPDGKLDALSRVDLERYAQQLDMDLAPVWVLLDEQDPVQAGDLPRRVELGGEDPSQNFSYMVQWWIFAAIAAGGYPLVLRAVARGRARGDAVPVEEPATAEQPAARR